MTASLPVHALVGGCSSGAAGGAAAAGPLSKTPHVAHPHDSLRRSPCPAHAQVLDYDNVQQTLMPLLSRAYALIFMVRLLEGGWPCCGPWHCVLTAQLHHPLRSTSLFSLPHSHASKCPLARRPPTLAAGPIHDGHVREL